MHIHQSSKAILTLPALLLLCMPVWGQYKCERLNDIVKMIPECNQPLPNGVAVFNRMVNHFELKDSIVYHCADNTVHYTFMGEPVETTNISNLANNEEEMKLITSKVNIKINTRSSDYTAGGNKSCPLELSFVAVISYPEDQSEVLIFANSTLTRYNSFKGGKNGLYEEKHCNGNYLISGQYCQVDTILTDTSTVFNPNTFEEETVITKSFVHSKKTGTWSYYDINGMVEKKEEFSQCQ